MPTIGEIKIILIPQLVNPPCQVDRQANVNSVSTQCLGFDCFEAHDPARKASGRSLEAILEQGDARLERQRFTFRCSLVSGKTDRQTMGQGMKGKPLSRDRGIHEGRRISVMMLRSEGTP
jgi:hypothetical protein